MFSNEDIRGIFQLIPPEKGSGGSPPLVLSANGDGLLTLQYVQAEFEKFVSTKRDRVSASALADELDVDTDLVLQLVRETSTLALLSQNKRNIITKEERYSIEKQLQDLLRTQLVSKSTFSRDQDISMDSIDTLTHTDDDSTRLKDDFLEFDDYIISKSYQHVVKDAVSSELERSFEDAESVELSTEKVPGSPPVWYILQTVKNLLHETGKTSQFHIQEKTDSVRCVPTEFLERKRDVQITQLKDGALACVDLNSFWNDFRELYPSLKDVQTYLESEAEVELIGSVAVSNIWALKVGSQCLQELEQHGYVEFASKIESQLPPSIRNQTQEKVENQITTTYQQASHNSLHKASPYLLTPSKYESSRTALLDTAKTYASTQWTQLKDTPLKDPKFLTSTFLDTIPSPKAPLLQTLTKDRIIEKAIEDHFWASISALETQNETAFATFWLDTLILRFRTYEIGLNAIQDLKLQDQLADLLATYMQKEQLPDILSKVRSQGLLQSRKTRKNIQKLESALYIPSTLTAVPTTATTTSTATENDKEPGKLTLQTLTTTLSKFSKKQNIPEPSPADLSSYKTTLLSEITRRFQKQAPSKKQKSSDGPVLFLTLVIILLARYFPGVVYATGKFAPRLLKVLREKVDEDVFERLEGWKEKAKLGTLSGEDREGMRGMALALGVEGGGGLGLEAGVEGEGGDDEG